MRTDGRTDRHDEADSRFSQYLRTWLTMNGVVLVQTAHVFVTRCVKICHVVQNHRKHVELKNLLSPFQGRISG